MDGAESRLLDSHEVLIWKNDRYFQNTYCGQINIWETETCKPKHLWNSADFDFVQNESILEKRIWTKKKMVVFIVRICNLEILILEVKP